jgi:Ca-dependent carbohydrate-binding module xylan-binding/Glycosyl hydrolase family 26
VRARGDYCSGPAQMTVTVEGASALDTAVGSTAWSDVPVPTPWPGGTHQVQVAFTNDYLGGGCDRNLRLDRVSVQPAAVPTPPPAGRLFGLSSTGPDQGIATAAATATSLGRHLDVVNFYQAWVWNTPLPVTQLREIAATGARPEITWEPWDPRQGVTQPAYTTSGIATGGYDSYVTGWARAAAAYGQPILLRFGHEMNGNWYPWSPTVNGGSPGAYLAAYRHVHDLFRAAGATNVSWVWSPNISQGMPTTLDQVYPGAGYVDIIGVDGYNGGSDVSYMGGWRTPQQVFDPTLQALRQLAPNVPVILNETGSSENGGDKAAWITQLFSYLAGSTQVSGLIWFDFATPGQADWRLATSTSSLGAAEAALTRW